MTTFNERVFVLVSGFAVFIAVTLLLADKAPELAYAILVSVFIFLLISHSNQVTTLIGQFNEARNR